MSGQDQADLMLMSPTGLNAELGVKMTELEKIEFNRRADIAYSVIEAAARCFGLRSELDERIKSAAKAANSYWYWFFIVMGVVMHYSPSHDGSGLNAGSWVIFATRASGALSNLNLGNSRPSETDVKRGYTSWK